LAVLGVLALAAVVTVAREVAHAVAQAVAELVLIAGIAGGAAAAGAVVLVVARVVRSQRTAPERWQARITSHREDPEAVRDAQDPQELPRPPRRRALPEPKQVHQHLHFHGVAPEDIAAILKQRQEDK
jgi:hypothetical protein